MKTRTRFQEADVLRKVHTPNNLVDISAKMIRNNVDKGTNTISFEAPHDHPVI
jgi:hypothetical protein